MFRFVWALWLIHLSAVRSPFFFIQSPDYSYKTYYRGADKAIWLHYIFLEFVRYWDVQDNIACTLIWLLR